MQFNGHNNLIENNEIYKALDYKNSPYGCAGVNVLGHNNVVRNNVVDVQSYPNCWGVLLEWDIADENLIENNVLFGMSWSSVKVEGGDNNIIRNNQTSSVIEVRYPDGSSSTGWPCNEPKTIRPANVSGAPDYDNYYNPRECASRNNQIYGNVIIESFQNK